MNDFDYDVKQKKNLARNAQYRKNGSKSRKCTLPHESLSKKELAALSGPVLTYNLSKPMTWDVFSNLPEAIRTEYLRKLNTRFNVGSNRLAQMFGVSSETARKAQREANVLLDRSHRMSATDISAWEFWLSDIEPKLNTEETEPMHDSKLEDPCELPIETAEPESAPTHEAQPPVLKNGKLFFEGIPSDVAEAITAFLTQTERRCKVSIKFDYE